MFIIRTVYRSRLSPESFATFSCTILLPRTSSVWFSIRMESTKPIIVCMRNENRTKFVLQEIEVSDSVDAARFAIRRKYWTERPKQRVTVTNNANQIASKQAARPVVGPPHYAPAPGLDLWPFDLKSGVRVTVTWATSVPILVFLGLSVLDLGPMYVTDVRRQTIIA